MSKKVIGTTLALAAALTFAAAPVTSTMAATYHAQVKCMGGNACKGKGACQTKANACKGHNSCKGQGGAEKMSKAACKKAGGKVVK
jgi:hypothetical protein